MDLEGAGAGSWRWGLGAGELPDEDRKPDAFIEGRGLVFAKIAGRRLPAEAALDEGSLVIGGDEGLGDAILEHIRAYP